MCLLLISLHLSFNIKLIRQCISGSFDVSSFLHFHLSPMGLVPNHSLVLLDLSSIRFFSDGQYLNEKVDLPLAYVSYSSFDEALSLMLVLPL